ncbi:cytochrome oxidase subunit VIII [Trypanosoma equiperdum]|uniref:Cytochrome c oxidase VIII (COX VIII), putative n=3 Tax=Trypanozoon TaxID=39700 RepID=Q583E7_TRYB2|nr:cytochrome c oxidase VIII (COX VIII), putative [Trypanosoma brucei gambiense DAL972]XP_844611.1 cytochrome c oxidase VIII (COX VIII), putative [Trypanosoma brucei brucei TREU927]AAX80508.1 cytochrome c oxidase VIII (COX VIII), putative [Trypanosoma brucei]SCU72637.1 cytochrome oxidase subunit VIII [Trypanosoma equiperdum]AAZ11052.1 cytochrome c oxidase VIII (COX VIII), putative [Trypanosoma brucei brucei TREU927]CBH10780.1 cytochrome c oxidase VIII (COX VIII), putative [Trypanosoma brucei g|eukprot:XP_011773068.1 cytochrome c oxidase VIII (COX VIII), putative [Trypanosoma brucei gambiense DAL972]
MIRRTAPAVSFTTSHRALMLRTNRPLLSADMHSLERFKVAWDEMPVHLIGASRKQSFEWYWKCMYQLGIRSTYRMTKSRVVMNWCAVFVFMYLTYISVCFSSFYHIYYQDWPEEFKRENARAYAQSKGSDVWAADGKFIKPYFHINPPMLTMTTEDL